MRPKMEVPLTIRFDRELPERMQRAVERNRRSIDPEIIALVDAALVARGASYATASNAGSRSARGKSIGAEHDKPGGPMDEMRTLVDEFVGIWDQKFPPARALIRT